MGDTMDLTFLEGAGILVVMLVTMFIDEINPWITTLGGVLPVFLGLYINFFSLLKK